MALNITIVLVFICDATAAPKAAGNIIFVIAPICTIGAQLINPAMVCNNNPIPNVTKIALDTAADVL